MQSVLQITKFYRNYIYQVLTKNKKDDSIYVSDMWNFEIGKKFTDFIPDVFLCFGGYIHGDKFLSLCKIVCEYLNTLSIETGSFLLNK